MLLPQGSDERLDCENVKHLGEEAEEQWEQRS